MNQISGIDPERPVHTVTVTRKMTLKKRNSE